MLARIDNYYALDMLIDRLHFWTDDEITLKLFEIYYESMIESGAYEGCEFNVMSIVDNDYINWLDVITEDEFDDYDISGTDDERIEAEYTDNITYYLVRC